MLLLKLESVRLALLIVIWQDLAVYGRELNVNESFIANRIRRNTVDSESVDDVCGTVVVMARPLIAYGQPTQPGEFPWHAALYYSKNNKLNYNCGASLVSKYHIITAAHCVTQPHTNLPLNLDSLLVYLGKYYFKKFSAPGIQEREVSDIIAHPQYNAQSYSNDIAVVKFESPAEITDYVRPICLWQGSVDVTRIINKQGTVAGFGTDETGQFTETLMQANMPVVLNERCIFSFPGFYSRYLSSKTFCAGFQNGTTVCNGDSGSGIVFAKANSKSGDPIWQLRGIVSVGPAQQEKFKCDSLHFAIFVDVAKYLDWINRTMKKCSSVSGCRDITKTPLLETDSTENSNSNEAIQNKYNMDHTQSFPNESQTSDDNIDEICGTVVAIKEAEFPWHAAVYRAKGINLLFICGASLISKYHVLTAAHCIQRRRSKMPLSPADIVVYLGKYYLKGVSNQGIQDRQVSDIIPHPQYDAQNYENNIAIIKFTSPAEITDYVRPICLWKESPELGGMPDKQGNMVGWGYDKFGKPIEELRRFKMPVVTLQTCLVSFLDNNSEFTYSNTYCAGIRNDKSICNADSGSGMFFPKFNSNATHPRWQFRGLVSIRAGVKVHHQFVCDPSHFVVFTDAAQYRDWIRETMQK